MQMTNEEIVRNYNEAKNKTAQIGILADLNCCPKSEIRNILREAGIKLSGNPNFGKATIKKKPKAKDELKAAAEEIEKQEEEKTKRIPDVVRHQLLEDIKKLDEEIGELLKKKKELLDFVYENL